MTFSWIPSSPTTRYWSRGLLWIPRCLLVTVLVVDGLSEVENVDFQSQPISTCPLTLEVGQLIPASLAIWHLVNLQRTTAMLNTDMKVLLVTLMLEHKAQLFGQFSSTVSKQSKDKAWEEITQRMVQAGAVFKDTTNLRLVQWPNIQRSTKLKVDKNARTGEGKAESYTELDELVLQLLGKESGKVKALPVADPVIIFDGPVPVAPPEQDVGTAGASQAQVIAPEPVGHSGDGPSAQSIEDDEIMPTKKVGRDIVYLRKRKLELECQKLEADIATANAMRLKAEMDLELGSKKSRLMDLQERKLQLEIRQLEKATQ